MSTVVSATFYRAQDRKADFLSRAYGLLDQAHSYLRARDLLLAVDCGYQAALRAAGARLVGGRARGSAWERLRRIDAAGARQAAHFQGWSAVRARAVVGLAIGKSATEVNIFLADVASFIEEVEGRLPLVA